MINRITFLVKIKSIYKVKYLDKDEYPRIIFLQNHFRVKIYISIFMYHRIVIVENIHSRYGVTILWVKMYNKQGFVLFSSLINKKRGKNTGSSRKE